MLIINNQSKNQALTCVLTNLFKKGEAEFTALITGNVEKFQMQQQTRLKNLATMTDLIGPKNFTPFQT
jgi:hypothetical protein